MNQIRGPRTKFVSVFSVYKHLKLSKMMKNTIVSIYIISPTFKYALKTIISSKTPILSLNKVIESAFNGDQGFLQTSTICLLSSTLLVTDFYAEKHDLTYLKNILIIILFTRQQFVVFHFHIYHVHTKVYRKKKNLH